MCKVVKPITEYGRKKKGYYGRAARCKSCCVLVQNEYTMPIRLTPNNARD